jgi:hypothetical protein
MMNTIDLQPSGHKSTNNFPATSSGSKNEVNTGGRSIPNELSSCSKFGGHNSSSNKTINNLSKPPKSYNNGHKKNKKSSLDIKTFELKDQDDTNKNAINFVIQ